MTRFLRPVALLLALTPLLLGCEKNDSGELDGPMPNSAFTVTLDTSKYPIVATFTSTSTGSFIGQWDFGDGSDPASGAIVQHTYLRAGRFEAKLIAAGSAGTTTSAGQILDITSPCTDAVFQDLTGCGSRAWALTTDMGAITRYDAGGAMIYQSPANGLSECLADDDFTFSSDYHYTYGSYGQTFNGTACGTARDLVSDFVFVPSTNGNLPRVILQANKSFVGLVDSAVNKTYEIVQVSSSVLVLQNTNADGSRTVATYKKAPSGVERANAVLTGGTARTWVLDNTIAAPIIVGTEGNPGEYYPGTPAPGLLPDCQADDEYTFVLGGQFTYDAKAQTLVGIDRLANDAEVRACAAPRTTLATYTLEPAVGSGIAQFRFSDLHAFVGVTDLQVPTATYRILALSRTKMTIRGGRANDIAVFTMQLKVK